MKEITALELKDWMDQKADFQLIDVREEHEYEQANLGGLLIPLSTIVDSAEKISKDKKVVIHCKAGARSAAAIHQLEQMGFDKLYNLKGGILAYAKDIDNSLVVL